MGANHIPSRRDDVLDVDDYLRDPAMVQHFTDAQVRTALRTGLVARRRSLRLTQQDVAAAMETTQSAISEFESGANDPHLSTLQRYARAVAAQIVVTLDHSADLGITEHVPCGRDAS